MLQQGEPTPQVQEWYDKLAPVVAEAQETLRQVRPGKLALRSGCERDADGSLRLTFFWQEYVISGEDFAVRRADTGAEAPSFFQSLILTYLATADGTTPSSRWIGFRDLPDGMFYVQAFQGYTGGRLVRELESGVELLSSRRRKTGRRAARDRRRRVRFCCPAASAPGAGLLGGGRGVSLPGAGAVRGHRRPLHVHRWAGDPGQSTGGAVAQGSAVEHCSAERKNAKEHEKRQSLS